MNIRYHVELSEAERCELTALVGRASITLKIKTSPRSARGRQRAQRRRYCRCCGCRRLDRLQDQAALR